MGQLMHHTVTEGLSNRLHTLLPVQQLLWQIHAVQHSPAGTVSDLSQGQQSCQLWHALRLLLTKLLSC